MSTISPEKRARAAKMGWVTRRQQPEPPTPDVLAVRRVHALLRTVDPRLGRLYVCDQAAALLHHYTDAHPGDPRPARLLAVGRGFAEGTATNQERLNALRVLRPYWKPIEHLSSYYFKPEHFAIQVLGFTLNKDTEGVIYWGSFWAWESGIAPAERGNRQPFHESLIAALQALQ